MNKLQTYSFPITALISWQVLMVLQLLRTQAKESVRKRKREGPFGKPFWETSKTPSKWPRAPNGENRSQIL